MDTIVEYYDFYGRNIVPYSVFVNKIHFLHNLNGPALIITTDNAVYTHYIVQNKKHRIDGPASYMTENNKVLSHSYYIDDCLYNFKEYCSILKLSDEKIFELKLMWG